MSVADRVRDLVLPLLDDRQLDLYDVELQGPVLRVVVDNPPGRSEGLDLDVLADATRAVSRALDDADPIPGRYTLEVTSPGLERTLRRPEHFERAVGETVKIRTVAGVDDERRVEGQLVAADETGITVRTGVADDGTASERRLAYDDIERARTVFEWGPQKREPKS
ncbi:MAG TPA: ribosome maturation factor RimP [Acidimicrobiales bacterium]|jgi:ribosome maturation factor RimP|nr:ribosome maturation factor RimP [Acidimicrobiales bacterium]